MRAAQDRFTTMADEFDPELSPKQISPTVHRALGRELQKRYPPISEPPTGCLANAVERLMSLDMSRSDETDEPSR